MLGIGASHPDKDWSDFRWLEFLAGLRRQCAGTVFLIGGRQNQARAKNLIEHTSGTAAINACDLALIEAVALLRLADLFIGTDSGPMNLAVAAATDAFALFGATPVLKYSKFIHPIVPEGGPSPGGMQRISPAAVLEQVEPLLVAREKPEIRRGYCSDFALSPVRLSTKRMAIGRPATAPPMPSLKCSGVQRLSAAFTASR